MDYGGGGGAVAAVSATAPMPSQMVMPANALAVQPVSPGYGAAAPGGANYAYGAPTAYALAPVAAPSTPSSPAQAPYEIISHRVFVGGFAPGTTEADLRAFFEQHGTVREVKVIRNTEGAGKGYGFVTFDNENEAAAVRSLPSEKLEFKGRRLNLGPAMRRLNHDTTSVAATAPIYSTGPYYYQPTALVPVDGGYALATQAYAPSGYYIVSGSAPQTQAYMQQTGAGTMPGVAAPAQTAHYQLGSYTYTPGVTPPTQQAMMYQPLLTPATGSGQAKSPIKVQPSGRPTGTPTRGGGALSPTSLRRSGAATMHALQQAAGGDSQGCQMDAYGQMSYDPSKLSVPQQQGYQWIQQPPTSMGQYNCQQSQSQQQPMSTYYAAAPGANATGSGVNLSCGAGAKGEVLTHYSQMFYHQQPSEFYAQEIAQRSQQRMVAQQQAASAPNLVQAPVRSPVNPNTDGLGLPPLQ